MRVLFISKYPPIEGGVSSGNYWLAKALGERKVEVNVVTNALCVEEMYRAKIDLADIATLKKHQPKNVFFNSLDKKPPTHIPYSEAYLSRLVNLGLKVISERGADVIYAHYLEPYAMAGFVLKKITGLPLVVRHAGSDIYRLFRNQDFRYFFAEAIKGSDKLIFSKALSGIDKALGFDPKKIVQPPPTGGVNSDIFNPEGEKFNFEKYSIKIPTGTPIFTYLGKAAQNKGISEMIEAFSGINEDFRFIFLSGGKIVDTFVSEAKLKKGLDGKFIHMDFLPPWEVPALMRSSTAVLDLENKFPIQIHSPSQPREAIASETPLILSQEIFNKLNPFFPSTKELFNIVEDPCDIKKLETILISAIVSPGNLRENAQKIREEFLKQNNWEKYVDFYLSLFSSLI